ncbi:MAG: hypothetical protein RL213_1514 [Bacteroidota bacterium]
MMLIAAVFAIGGCSKDEPTTTDVPEVSVSQIKKLGLAMSNANDVDQIAVAATATGNVNQRLSGNGLPYFAGSCAVVTDDPVAGRTIVDFGASCIGNDSVERKGKIITDYTGDIFNEGVVITISFENYYVNGRHIEGTRTITNLGINDAGNMHWQVVASNMKSTDPTGEWRSWNSTRDREMIQGFGTPDISDDVFLINGTADGAFSDGNTFSANILNLKRDFACSWIQEGYIIGLIRGKVYSVDFGRDCDNEVTITFPDQHREILFLR